MKKTLATLLVLAMVASVCGMLFASAGVSEAVAELEAELEALVGADDEAAVGKWNIDITVDETGKVTAVCCVTGLEGKDIVLVESPLFYDSTKMTLLNATLSDGSLDCITTQPDATRDWENMSRHVVDLDDDGEADEGFWMVVLCIANLVTVDSFITETNLYSPWSSSLQRLRP